MVFQPDVEELLKRFSITKPNEQFQVDPVVPDPDVSPEPLNKSEFSIPLLPLVLRLEDEASKVQDMLDILTDTASELTVPVSPEEAGFLGQTVSTTDYLRSLEASDTEDPLRQRKQQTFEHGILTTYGQDNHWPLLLSSDLLEIRNSLLNARDTIEGRLLAQQEIVAASGGNRWKDSVLNSDLVHVHEQMILASEQVRFKMAQTVFTMNFGLPASELDKLLSLSLNSSIERIRPTLVSICSFLRNVRFILTHSQLLLGLEYKRSRDAVLNIVETAIVDRLINILVAKLSGIIGQLVDPVLGSLEDGFGGSGPLNEFLSHEVSQQLMSVVGGTMQAIVFQYKGIVADLLREHEQKTHHQLDKLQALGERNIAGRWIVHIDQVITIVEKSLTETNLSRELAAQLIGRAISPPPPPDLPLLKRFLGHPELSQAQNIEMKVRSLGITPQLEGPPGVPFFGVGQSSMPAFGTDSINTSSAPTF